MYLINMAKRIFFDNQGRLRILPWGFHLIEDLVLLYQMVNDLKQNQLSQEANRGCLWKSPLVKNVLILYKKLTMLQSKDTIHI